MAQVEELYTTLSKNGTTFRCVKSQLFKTGGKCPIWDVEVYPEMKGVFDAVQAKRVILK